MNQILKGKKYSVAVVATMSSGKSTFLNAMLGARILPAKQEACTAKVYSIEDDDNAESFQARCVKNGMPGPWEPASSDCLKAFNESDADEIEIIGNIKQIRNTRTGHAILLYDTPGPNNSLNHTHASITENIIRNSQFCALVYVRNAQQLGTDDEFKLLAFIREEIEKSSSSSDVLFILNKIDEFRSADGDSIRDSLTKCKKGLRDAIGFPRIIILPVSSKLALLIRLMLGSLEEINKNEIPEEFRRKNRNLTKYFQSGLSEEDQDELLYLLKTTLRNKRKYAGALQFSPQVKHIFLRLKRRLSTKRNYAEKVFVSNRLFDMSDIRLALLLSGIPVVERYLENKLRKAAKKQ